MPSMYVNGRNICFWTLTALAISAQGSPNSCLRLASELTKSLQRLLIGGLLGHQILVEQSALVAGDRLEAVLETEQIAFGFASVFRRLPR